LGVVVQKITRTCYQTRKISCVSTFSVGLLLKIYLFILFRAQPKLAESVRTLAKDLYDLTKSCETTKDTGEALPELIIDHFDDEQVWQQLELQNSDSYDSLIQKVSHIMAKKKAARTLKINEPVEESAEEEIEEEEKPKKKFKKKTELKAKIPLKESVVDDKFFKLQQMEEFLLKEEDESKGETGNDESIDLFAGYSDEDEEENVSLPIVL